MTTIPERIRDEARKAIYDTGRGMIGRERNYLEDRVCRALLAAEKRGREEAAYELDELVERRRAKKINRNNGVIASCAGYLRAAIRSTN